MKYAIAIIPLLLTLSTASANTVRIGNGGDTISMASPAMISIIVTTPHKLRLITHSWMKNRVDSLVLPKERFQEFEQAIISAPLEIQDKPCMVNGQPKTAAAYQTPYRSICISTTRLEKTAGKQVPELQVIALLGHEYLHLLGYNEADAVDFQRNIVDHMIKYGIPTYNANALKLVDSIYADRFKTVDWNDKNNVASFSQDIQSSVKKALRNLIDQQESLYPVLTADNNVISDILLRISYLNLMVAANWGTGPDLDELRDLLHSRYFPLNKNGKRDTNTAGSISQLFRYMLPSPLLYSKMQIPYIEPSAGKPEFASVLEETDSLIEELNQSLMQMSLDSTTIRFVEK